MYILKNYYNERKKLWHYLINCVEKIRKPCLQQINFDILRKFLKFLDI